MVASDSNFPMPKNAKAKIWRYMNLSKFVALLEQEGLWFSSPLRFNDPFEGSFPHVPVKLKGKPKKEDIEALAKSFEQVRDMAMRTCFINCWFQSEHESEALWKLYGASNESIAIQTDVSRMSDLTDDKTYLGMVTYRDYSTENFDGNNIYNLLFQKRVAFAHEREFRVLTARIDKNNLNGFVYKMNLKKLIQSIVIAPDASDYFVSFMFRVLKGYDLDHLIKPSQLKVAPALRPVYSELREEVV